MTDFDEHDGYSNVPPNTTDRDFPDGGFRSPPSSHGNDHIIPNGFPSDIGVVGLQTSGKTLLMSGMVYSLDLIPRDSRTNDGYACGVYELSKKNKAFAECDRNADSFLIDASKIGDNGRLPQGTTTNHPFALWVGYKDDSSGKSGRYIPVGMADSKGAFSTIEDDDHPYWKYIRGVRGIIFAVSPTDKGGEIGYNQFIQNFVNRMKSVKKSDLPWLAICITKADLMTNEFTGPEDANRKQNSLAETKRILVEVIGERAFNKLSSHFNSGRNRRMKIFITSAVGWYRDEKHTIQSNYTDEGGTERLANPRVWRPYQAAYPFLWLFDKIERERIKQTRPPLYWRWVYARRVTNEQLLRQAVNTDRAPSQSLYGNSLY